MRAYAATTSLLALAALLASPIRGGVIVDKIDLEYRMPEPRETRTRIYAQGSKLRMVFTVNGEPSGEVICDFLLVLPAEAASLLDH